MKTMLKLEDGILLKEYPLPWREDGYNPPPRGWYPDDMPDIIAMTQRLLAELFKAEGAEALTKLAQQKARLKSWKTFEHLHQHRRETWRGWVPIVFQFDRVIGKAYRRLFVEINGGKRPIKQAHAQYPPDGLYELRNNRMIPFREDDK